MIRKRGKWPGKKETAGPASAAQAAAANSATPTFTALGLNHLALRVTDPDRAQAFYQRHLGMTALSIGAALPKVLACGPHTVTLFKGARPEIDHFCFTVPNYDAKAAEARVRAAGLTPEVEDDRVHFRDPSFNNLQAVPAMAEGGQVADVIAVVASIDPVMGGVDR